MKIAVKRLTVSDLTLFRSQFRKHQDIKQKALNLNADVLAGALFPGLRDALPVGGRLPIDLYVYGPGKSPELNLQRKIVKGAGYKNWRLNGELIFNPETEPHRFDNLEPGDIAVLGFDGAQVPDTIYLYLVSSRQDPNTHRSLDHFLGESRMREMPEEELRTLLSESGLPDDHALRGLDLEADLEEAAEGASQPRIRLARRAAAGRRLDRAQLARAREVADAIGRCGEEIARTHLEDLKSRDQIQGYEWVSDINAVSAHDFEVTRDGVKRRVEVKSTSGGFNRAFHISTAELIEAAESIPYDLIRVSEVDLENGAGILHFSSDFNDVARSLLKACETLPEGIEVDGMSVNPEILPFSKIGPVSVTDSP